MPSETDTGGYVCGHLAAQEDPPVYYYWFTGSESSYNVICGQCQSDLANASRNLVKVPDDFFFGLSWDSGHVGSPEILLQGAHRSFDTTTVELRPAPPSRLATLRPVSVMNGFQWIGVLEDAAVVGINANDGSWQYLFQVPEATFRFDFSPTGWTTYDSMPLSTRIGLHISASGRFVALTSDHSKSGRGLVVDLEEQRVISLLDRRGYHPEQTSFPFAFFEHEEETFYVHATDWNRLDISEASSGRRITDRILERNVPGRYIDYFHGALLISPDNQWIADDGWVWSPLGVPRVWNLMIWLHDRWASETPRNGPDLGQREDWGDAFCWIDGNTLALWGFCMINAIPAVRIYDVTTGKLIQRFAGPFRSRFFFDEYLFSASDDALSVWDIATGERVALEPGFAPIAYHPQTKQFASVESDKELRIAVMP